MKKSIMLTMVSAFMFGVAHGYPVEVNSEDVEHVEMEELPSILDGEQREPSINLHDDCFDNNNARACQKLLALAEEITSVERSVLGLERARLHAIIAAQQKTIATHEGTIQTFNKMHERKSARKGAKRGAPRSQGYGMACGPKPD